MDAKNPEILIANASDQAGVAEAVRIYERAAERISFAPAAQPTTANSRGASGANAFAR